ncbi:MAG: hypothetical protein HZA13_08505 [Nitrospirae bacterium]|nr:hypothetical protein [Nitrospirota bacterium]
MKRHKGIILVLLVTAMLFCRNIYAHEIVGEVTALMMHMQNILSLIESNKIDDAFHETGMVFEDFSHSMGMGMKMEGIGLKSTSDDIDKRYNTNIGKKIEVGFKKRDHDGLMSGLQSLGFLLMLEKFDVLQSGFDKKDNGLDVQKTIFWLGRNYFSYLLEPALAKKNPVEAQRLDRILDSMLYRLEDRRFGEFIELRVEFEKGVIKAFKLGLNPVSSPNKGGTAK